MSFARLPDFDEAAAEADPRGHHTRGKRPAVARMSGTDLAVGATSFLARLANTGPQRPPSGPPRPHRHHRDQEGAGRLGYGASAQERVKRRSFVASTGRRSWRQAKMSLAREAKARVARPIVDIRDRVSELQDARGDLGSLAVLRREMAELSDIVAVQVDVGNQTTELLGRLLASTSDRLDLLEEGLRELASAGRPRWPGPTGRPTDKPLSPRPSRLLVPPRNRRSTELRSVSVTPGPVVVDLQALQSPDFRGRGIARYAQELAVALERGHPGVVGRYLLNPDLPPPAISGPWPGRRRSSMPVRPERSQRSSG